MAYYTAQHISNGSFIMQHDVVYGCDRICIKRTQLRFTLNQTNATYQKLKSFVKELHHMFSWFVSINGNDLIKISVKLNEVDAASQFGAV